MKSDKKFTVLFTKAVSSLCLLFLTAALFTGCSAGTEQADTVAEAFPGSEAAEQESTEQESAEQEEQADTTEIPEMENRKFLIGEGIDGDLPDYVPSVADYQLAPDLSNIENLDRFYLQAHTLEKLAENHFVVINTNRSEFFDLYEENRYMQIPNFITVDSIMHTYHLYFSMLQKNTEQNYLCQMVKDMSRMLQDSSMRQYEELKGSEWEDAAKINVAFFTVGNILAGNDMEVPDYVKDVAEQELKLVQEAAGIEKSPLNGEDEDYSQYKPRGYYDGNEELEKYFRTMMWYGRRNFKQKDETMDRCALLMSVAFDEKSFKDWEQVYMITSFFTGASDDSGVYEYLPLIQEAYGDEVTTAALIGNEAAFQTYHELTGKLEPPAINSVVFVDDEGKTDKTQEAKGYRFMGQRFSIDAAIFTQLCYSKVKEDAGGNKRLLPDGLDVPAAFGSETALELLEEDGNFAYEGYTENMTKVRKAIEKAPDTLWRASLYGEWMYTLKPLIEEKGEGYPSFMQKEQWKKKNLESFLSSYTELKHDTILYSKQFMAQMGGGDEIPPDDRGYVEPEAEVYARLCALTKNTSDGLENFGVISDNDRENLERMSGLANRLKEISIKELTNETVTEDDYELIRSYGGNLEHFWSEAVKDENGEESKSSQEFPASLVVDIATDPNGSVLEQAIGGMASIYVVVPVEGKLRIAQGAVFSYYQFIQPIDERLTDSEWRRKIGMELTDDSEYVIDESIKQPEWTQGYRSEWIYE